MGRSTYTFKPDIHKSFNRGFTTYFADGRVPHQASMLTPKSIGEYVGKVKDIRGNRIIVSSVLPFSNGDGLCFFNSQGNLVGFRVNIAEGNRIIPFKMPAGIKQGMVLYRNFDQAFQKILAKPSGERKVLLDMTLTIKADELQLSVTDEHGHQGQASLPYSYQETHSEQEDNMRRQLTKLGGTPFSVGNLQIIYEVEKPFVPSSQLTALRRDAIEGVQGVQKVQGVQGVQGVQEVQGVQGVQEVLALRRCSGEQSSEQGVQGVQNCTSYIVNGTSGASLHQELMHCRYCLRHEMGYCTKLGKKAPWREPLSLHLADGKSFTLKFDCRQCEMYVMR
jgi:putative protease